MIGPGLEEAGEDVGGDGGKEEGEEGGEGNGGEGDAAGETEGAGIGRIGGGEGGGEGFGAGDAGFAEGFAGAGSAAFFEIESDEEFILLQGAAGLEGEGGGFGVEGLFAEAGAPEEGGGKKGDPEEAEGGAEGGREDEERLGCEEQGEEQEGGREEGEAAGPGVEAGTAGVILPQGGAKRRIGGDHVAGPAETLADPAADAMKNRGKAMAGRGQDLLPSLVFAPEEAVCSFTEFEETAPGTWALKEGYPLKDKKF